eukprot:CAMPEP_0194725920 /NCGR_PEP_ID=MMETSP0296-20130528/28665_1 /TAXON_ID=39354 /ORGANISM="Heterosigma akashiwo, Strain CCMP2393" /LENGTH=80 /DNA_ID=CAMNT_0039630657 /DNA_START=279 /DNA_END=521 /DNA_ORIENTATION=-
MAEPTPLLLFLLPGPVAHCHSSRRTASAAATAKGGGRERKLAPLPSSPSCAAAVPLGAPPLSPSQEGRHSGENPSQGARR